MAITRSTLNPTGAQFRSQGRFLDSAATPAAAVIDLGFAPKYFAWINMTDRITYEKFEGEPADETFLTVAAGTRTLDTNSIIVLDVATGSQDGSQGAADQTNAGVVNNVAYPGPSTIIDSTATEIPGTQAGFNVTIDASVVLQNKQYQWVAFG